MIGQTILHYKILEKLGEGGMGVVYKAHDTTLDRPVALKFLPPHLSASEQDKARFIQEARAASALNHPNICTIHAIEECDGQLFIVMEYVDGQTLREKKGSISFKQAIDFGIQIAEGLAAAHEKGIVHRDIKPENIMVRKDGICQVMDFGLAKLRGNVTRLTKEGSTIGTAGYMSPEQVQGQEVDHRSDIFSLGVLLYEMVTGEPPFKGVHETALLYEIVNVDPAPMSAAKPAIDPALDAIVLECLDKDPNERTQSVKQVAVDLKHYKRESTRQRASRITSVRPVAGPATLPIHNYPAPPVPASRTIFWPVLSGVLALAVILVAWAPWRSGKSSLTVSRVSVSLPKSQQLNAISYSAIAISPDASKLVVRANAKLYARGMNSFELVPLPGTEDASSPFFSPDGRWLGFFAGGKLKKIPLSGGAAITLIDAADNRGAAWGADGSIVYSPTATSGIMRISSDGGSAQPITTVDTTKGERSHRWPSFLPDGKTVIFTVGTLESPDYYEDCNIDAVDVQTKARKTILSGASTAQYVPAGYLIYSHAGGLLAAPFDLGKVALEGTSFPVVENVKGDPTTGTADFCFSQNGTLAYLPGRVDAANRQLVLLDRSGAATPFPAPVQSYLEPRMSPDGKRIAIVIQSGKDYDVWIYDISRNTLNRLTFGGTNRTPVWSPDGKRIIYWSTTEGKSRILARLANGSGQPDEIAAGLGRTYIDCWSHDGSLLLLDMLTPHSQSDIVFLPVTGDRKPRPFIATKYDEWQSTLSPNGKWLAYISNETGVYQVYVQPFPSGEGKWQISAGEGYEPHWSADGKVLYYYVPGKIMAVDIQESATLAIGSPRVHVNGYVALPLDSGISYDLCPDGQHIVTTRPKEEDEMSQQVNLVLNWFDDIRNTVSAGK